MISSEVDLFNIIVELYNYTYKAFGQIIQASMFLLQATSVSELYHQQANFMWWAATSQFQMIQWPINFILCMLLIGNYNESNFFKISSVKTRNAQMGKTKILTPLSKNSSNTSIVTTIPLFKRIFFNNEEYDFISL